PRAVHSRDRSPQPGWRRIPPARMSHGGSRRGAHDMAQVAPYCKAYPATRFQEFAGWVAPTETGPAPGTNEKSPHDAVIEDYWFLQDTYVVTRGILPDEDIVFDQVTPEWIAFCKTTLGFAVPDDLIDDSSVGMAGEPQTADAGV